MTFGRDRRWRGWAAAVVTAAAFVTLTPFAVAGAPKGDGGGDGGKSPRRTTTTTTSTTTSTSTTSTTTRTCPLSPGTVTIDAWSATAPAHLTLWPATRPSYQDRSFSVPSGCEISSIAIRVEWGRGADLDLTVIDPRWPSDPAGWTNAEENSSDAIVNGGSEEVVLGEVRPGQWTVRTFGPRSTGVTYRGSAAVVVSR